MKLPVITNSQMRTFRRCAREHQYAYTLGYRSLERAAALRFGSLIHLGLEVWWKHIGHAEQLEITLAAVRDVESDPYDAARARVLLTGYHARWAHERYKALAVEAAFHAPLRNPETGASSRTYVLGGVVDGIAQDLSDLRVKLVEHKTASGDIGLGSDYWKRLQIDPQVSTYFAGAEALGFPVDECLYDVIGKPALRPAKATPPESRKYTKAGDLYKGQREHDETPEEFEERLAAHVAENPDRYYQRGTVVRLESEIEDAAHDAWQTARMIREAELSGRWPRNPDSCVRFGRTCEFFDVCTGTASLDDETRFRRVDNPHEELTEAA